MSLLIITGTAKCNKSDEIARLVSENDGLLIVPETHSLSAEKMLLKYSGALGFNKAEVLSFQRLAHRFSDSGPLGKRSVDPAGKDMALAMICQRHIKDLRSFSRSALKTGFSKKLLALIRELKRYNIDPPMLKEASEKAAGRLLSDKLWDISFIYEKYLEFIASGYTDSDDDLSRLYSYLLSEKPLAGRNIYIDRFSSFTGDEMLIIRALLSQAQSVTVALYSDPDSQGFQFASSEDTIDSLTSAAEELGLTVNEKRLSSNASREACHLEKNLFSYTPEPYSGETEEISLFTADSMYSEVVKTAGTILELVKNGQADFSDISVVCRDSETYSPLIKSIFPSFGIPFTDTERLSAAYHPLCVCITSAVEAAVTSASTDSVLRYLKSGFSGVEREDTDLLENYMLSCGIYPSQFFSDEKWNYKANIYKGSENDPLLTERINNVRDKILPPLLNLKNALKGKIDSETFCRGVYAFMEETHLPALTAEVIKKYNLSGDTDRAARTEAVYNSLIKAMDSLIACSRGESLPAQKFLSVFSEGIFAVTSAIIPSGISCVNFSSASRYKGSESPYVFIIGLNSGVFPKTPENDGILTDSDKKFLTSLGIKTSPGTEHLNYEELSLLYSVMNSAKKKLYLSYPLKDITGSPLSASWVVGKITQIFPGIKTDSDSEPHSAEYYISSPGATMFNMLDRLNRYMIKDEEIDDTWFMLYDWYKKHGFFIPDIPNAFSSMKKVSEIDKNITDALFSDGFKTSISRLECYSSCRFKYYMQYILNARPRADASFSRADVGTVLHRYAENVSRFLEENSVSWCDISDDDIKRVLDSTTRDYIDNGPNILKNSERSLYLVKRLEHLAYKMVYKIKEQFEYGGFTPLGSEIVFDEGKEYGAIKIPTPDGDVSLTGKIDRADVIKLPEGEFVRIVDYKSGSKTFSFSNIYSGLDLQLSVYMMALSSDGKKPGGMLYFKFDDPISAPGSNKTVKLDGLISDSEEFLSAIEPDSKVQKGKLTGKCYDAFLASEEGFNAIFKRVKKVIASLCTEMKKGSFEISPKGYDEKSPCTYCDYKAACAGNVTCEAIANIENDAWSYFSPADEKREKEGEEA